MTTSTGPLDATHDAPLPSPDVIGAYSIRRASFRRRLTMEAFDAVSTGHPMLALVEVDVTKALERIHQRQHAGERLTLFAFLVSCIARALADHPELNAVRSGGRIARFEDVDVNIPIELESSDGRFPHQLVLRRASTKSVLELYREIEAAKTSHASGGEVGKEDRWAVALMRGLLLVPGFIRRAAIRWIIRNPLRVKRHSGTTFVTSVGKVAAMPGFVIPFAAGPRATAFALGSVTQKPAVVGGEIAIRSFQSLTMVFDHDLVDGAPAARFATRLQALIESGDGL